MEEYDDYEEWLKITLTKYDAEVTKIMIDEIATIKRTQCKVCDRPMTKNECEGDIRDTDCYYCHLQSHK